MVTDIISARESGSTGFRKIYPFEEKRAYFEYLFEHNPTYSSLPEAVKTLLLECKEYGFSIAISRNSALLLATHIGKLLSQNEFEILQRFAKVFEQAYTRFLDLQKAEAQAKEAQIEAALERVRSRSMGMQRGEDLKSVVKVLYDQLKVLGFKWGAASITIMDEGTGDIDWWMDGLDDGYELPERYHVPYFDHKGHKQQLEYWKTGSSYAVVEISGSDKKSYDNNYFNHTDFSRAPEHTKKLMISQEAVIFSMAFIRYGALVWSPTTLDEEQSIVLQRMAKVFEQSYIRFLDLQKAEAQAREAQIDAALEKIRATSLAMHH
jgi:hypothetical protein